MDKKGKKETVHHSGPALAAARNLYDKFLAMAATTGIAGDVLFQSFQNKSSVLGFSAAKPEHLNQVRKTLENLEIRLECLPSLNADGERILAGAADYREEVQSFVMRTSEARCRAFIDTVVVAAVAEAQRRHKTDPIAESEPTDRFIISVEQHIQGEPLIVGSVGFHGPLDYGILRVSEATYDLLRNNGAAVEDVTKLVLTLVEAKTPATFKQAQAQIEAQCLTLLQQTGRVMFPGALTDGECWMFFVAEMQKNGAYTVRRTSQMAWAVNSKVIAAILLEFIVNPGVLPPIFVKNDVAPIEKATDGGAGAQPMKHKKRKKTVDDSREEVPEDEHQKASKRRLQRFQKPMGANLSEDG